MMDKKMPVVVKCESNIIFQEQMIEMNAEAYYRSAE